MHLAEPVVPAFSLPSGAPLRAAAPHLVEYAPDTPGRDAVEGFIAAVYAQHYGARLRVFMPHLVALEDDDGSLLAAAGVRRAVEPLFLERYLDAPVERLLAHAAGQPVTRASIAEVGQFASMQPGQGRRLMAELGRLLAARGLQWVASTATLELRRIFERLRIAPLTLAPADPARLGAAAADWGSYYAHAPWVLAGEVRANLARFAR